MLFSNLNAATILCSKSRTIVHSYTTNSSPSLDDQARCYQGARLGYQATATDSRSADKIFVFVPPTQYTTYYICLQDSHTPAGEAERQKHSRDRGRGQGGSFGTIAANYLDGGDGRMCQTQSSDTRPNGEQTRSPEPKTPRPEWICQALKPLYIYIKKKKTSTVNPLVTSSTRSGD